MQGSAVVLYHYPCVDGGFAAWIAYMHMKNAYFVPHNPRELVDVKALPQTEKLYLLDYVGPSAAFLQECCSKFNEVILLDHHKTAVEMVEQMIKPNNLRIHLDMNKSGCMLAFEHFPVVVYGKTLVMLEYVQDNDLWEHALPESKEFTAGLSALNIDFRWDQNPSELATKLESLDAKDVIDSGSLILEERNRTIQSYLPKSYNVTLGGVQHIRAVEIQDDEIGITSQLGHELALMSPAKMGAVIVLVTKDGSVRVSLRGVEGVDTTVVAKQYGGGGHAGASGFGLKSKEDWDKTRE
jgi:oligoribonuclease NrnB/cAMP/cGMP phosphodiesterase (DHH superfamily)